MKKSTISPLLPCLLILALAFIWVVLKVNQPAPASVAKKPTLPANPASVGKSALEPPPTAAPDSPVAATPAPENATLDKQAELPSYIKRTRQAALDISLLPTRETQIGSLDRLAIFEDAALTIRWEEMADNGADNLAWYGSLVEDRLSMVTFTRLNDYTIIDVQSPAFGFYEIHGQDGNLAEVREFNVDEISQACKTSVLMAEYGDAAALEASEEPAIAGTVAAFDAKTVDVLMVYTSRARDLAGGRSAIAAKAQSAINGQNNNFNRSKIVHRMRLMGSRQVSRTASSSLATELGWVAGNSTVASMRNDTGADLVAMVSDKDSAGMRGIAQLPGAFSANYYDTLAGVWPHEAGHNFGCQHNSAGVYSYASGHYWTGTNGTQYGSIMSYIGSRVPYFSNPDVDYSGKSTGTSSRDNARCINNRGATTAGWKSSKTLIEPSCSIAASTKTPTVGTNFTLTISTKNGGPATSTSGKITFTLPTRMTIVSHDGGSDFNTSTKVWSVPRVTNGSTAKLAIIVSMDSGAGLTITPAAKITAIGSGFVDYNIYNNEGSVSVVPRAAVTPVTPALVLHYPLDEDSGNTAGDASDQPGAQDAATTYATPQWQPSGGMIGGSLRFTPSSSADVSQAFSHDSGTSIITNYPFTMALWVKTDVSSGYGVCSMLGDQTQDWNYFELAVVNSKANAMARNTTNSGVSAISPEAVSDNQWRHVAAVFNSATSRTLYVDGVAVATNTTSVPFVTNNKRFALGALMRSAPVQAYSGELDDVGLWNVALTQEHIAIIHALGRFSQVDLANPAVDELVAGGLTAGTSVTAGDFIWAPATGLTGPVGSTGIIDGNPYLVLNTSGGGLIGGHPYQAASFWFDQNGSGDGFGLENEASYNWFAPGVWNPDNTGTGAPAAWSTDGDDAFLVGAGEDTSYTISLGPAGANHVSLRNLFLNSDGAEPAEVLAAGDAEIGTPGDTGELRFTGPTSVGTAGGVLTIHSPVNLGADNSLNFLGGSVAINSLVSGAGAGISLASGGAFSGELAEGSLTLAHPGNSYTGPTIIDPGFSLEVTKLANGGITSSIGASSAASENLILNGGTLRYTGPSTSTNRSFILTYPENDPATGEIDPESDTETTPYSVIDVSEVDTVLTLSGTSAATSGGLVKTGEGTLLLEGANLHTGPVILRDGILSVAATTYLGDLNNLVFDGGTLRVTGTVLKNLTGHTTTFSPNVPVGFDIATSGNTFTVSQSIDLQDGGLTKSGAGALLLSAENTYTGETIVNAGAITLTHALALGSTSSVTLDSGSRVNFNHPSVQGPSNPTLFAMPVTITGTGGTLRFNGPNNRTNSTLNGLLDLDCTGIGTIVSFNAGTNYVNLLGGVTGTGSVDFQASGADYRHNHIFHLGGTLDYTGATRLMTTAASGRVILSDTALPSGTVLSMGAQNNIGTNVAQFDLNGNHQTLAGLQTFIFNNGGTGRNQVINTSPTPAVLIINNAANHTFGGNLGANGQNPIAGTAGTGNNFALVKSGSGTLTLTGINTYTGNTTVTGGVLDLNGSSIADAGKLVIDGGKVQITGTEVVDRLFFGAVQQAAGTWGATDSGADHIDDFRFSGTGFISVTSAPAPGFSSWIAGFGIPAHLLDPSDDADGDGINNLLEYVLGGSPAAPDAAAISPAGIQTDQNYVFTFKRSRLSEAGVNLAVEYGSGLGVWGSYPVGPAPGVTPVAIQDNTPFPGIDTVTVTIPTAGAPKFFARLRAEQE